MNDPRGQKKLKILQIYYEPFFSGISRHVIYLLETMSNRTYDHMVLCSTGDEKIRKALNITLGGHLVIIVRPGRFFSFSGFLQIIKIIRRQKVDVVHVHNLQTAAWAIPATLLSGCRKIIFTPHVDSFGIESLTAVVRRLGSLIRLFPLTFIAVSKAQYKRFSTLGIAKPDRVKFVANHIRASEFVKTMNLHRNMIRQKNHLPENAIIVSQIARLDRQKNPFFLIRVADLIRGQFPNILFLLIGEGPLKSDLAQEIKNRDMGGHVRLMGYREDAIELLHISDIVTFTSRWEGLPYSLLEAVCFRKPVVAIDIPGMRDVIVNGESGFLVEKPEQFVIRLLQLARSKELRTRMGKSGYLNNKDLFNYDHLAMQMTDIYK